MHVLYWIAGVDAYLLIGKLIATVSEHVWDEGTIQHEDAREWEVRRPTSHLFYICFPNSASSDTDESIFYKGASAPLIAQCRMDRRTYRAAVTVAWPFKVMWCFVFALLSLLFKGFMWLFANPWIPQRKESIAKKAAAPKMPELLPAEQTLKEIETLENERTRIDERIGVLRSQLGPPYRLETRETDAESA